MIITSTDSKKVAQSIQSTLVEKQLSPCVQLLPGVVSMYTWNNQVIKDNEFLLLIKTSTDNVESVKFAIMEMHNYDNPEVISLYFDILTKSYASWFNGCLNKIK